VAMAGVVNQSTAGLARIAMGAAGLSDNNAFIGASTHSGSETFTNTVDITGGRAKVPTRSGLNDGGTDAASTAYIANLLAAVSGKAIWGLTYANNGSDATNDLDIAAGGCMDGGGTYLMQLASGLTKQGDVAWSVGNNAGGLDTGTVGNNDYYIWLIARSDTGVVDALYSLKSGGADGIPTMPANYYKKRLIGWFKRSGGTIVAFKTYEAAGGGLDFAWSAPTLDINLANTLTTSRRTDSVKVPQNFSVIADLNIQVQDQTVPFKVWIACPDTTDAAPGGAAAPLGNAGEETATAVPRQIRVRTDAAGKIAARADIATVDFYNVSTMGFHCSRR